MTLDHRIQPKRPVEAVHRAAVGDLRLVCCPWDQLIDTADLARRPYAAKAACAEVRDGCACLTLIRTITGKP
jgi:hypothetical protein